MKKLLVSFMSLLLCVIFAGCSNSSETAAVTKVSQQPDVDLTSLSSTMVYSEVYNMLISPDEYVGKIVKMNGQFTVYSNEDNTQNYYAVVIADATACCQQGFEFVWDGHDYPDDYPEEGQEIEVTGEFQTYQEGELTYCHLIANDVQIL